MKKLLILLISLFLLLSSTSAFADDISDFQIEGISIGDSLLDYMTEDEILEEIKLSLSLNEYSYLNVPGKYVDIYLYEDFPSFEFMSFMINPKSLSKYVTNKNDGNEKYTILSVRGGINYIEDFNGCMQKRKEIDEDLSSIFKNLERSTSTYKSRDDPSGKSIVNEISYVFNSGAEATIYCLDYEENLRIKNNWTEGLNVFIKTPEIVDWFLNSE